jgi:MATE family multidrug resistance protein
MARVEAEFSDAIEDRRGDLSENLLQNDGNRRVTPSGDSFEEREENLSVWNEVVELTTLSLPVALSTLARLVIINTDTAFVGHLGEGSVMLSASSLATTWNGFLSNVVFAPGYALNSLCSQAIGAGNLKLAGVWLQLAIVFTSALCIPVLAGYFLTNPLVNLIVDEEAREKGVPHYAQNFNNVSMLVLWPMVMYMIIRQYFQAIQIVIPAMIVSGLTVAFNYAMNWVFVPENGPVGWGLEGSPFATFLSMLFQLGSFTLYVVVYQGYHKPYWGGWSWDCMERSRLKRFFKMVIPMAIGIILENSGLQLISFSTAKIGSDNVAAHAVLSSLWGMLWSLYWGVGLALQVRIGSKLGEGSVEGAKLVAKNFCRSGRNHLLSDRHVRVSFAKPDCKTFYQ